MKNHRKQQIILLLLAILSNLIHQLSSEECNPKNQKDCPETLSAGAGNKLLSSVPIKYHRWPGAASELSPGGNPVEIQFSFTKFHGALKNSERNRYAIEKVENEKSVAEWSVKEGEKAIDFVPLDFGASALPEERKWLNSSSKLKLRFHQNPGIARLLIGHYIKPKKSEEYQLKSYFMLTKTILPPTLSANYLRLEIDDTMEYSNKLNSWTDLSSIVYNISVTEQYRNWIVRTQIPVEVTSLLKNPRILKDVNRLTSRLYYNESRLGVWIKSSEDMTVFYRKTEDVTRRKISLKGSFVGMDESVMASFITPTEKTKDTDVVHQGGQFRIAPWYRGSQIPKEGSYFRNVTVVRRNQKKPMDDKIRLPPDDPRKTTSYSVNNLKETTTTNIPTMIKTRQTPTSSITEKSSSSSSSVPENFPSTPPSSSTNPSASSSEISSTGSAETAASNASETSFSAPLDEDKSSTAVPMEAKSSTQEITTMTKDDQGREETNPASPSQPTAAVVSSEWSTQTEMNTEYPSSSVGSSSEIVPADLAHHSSSTFGPSSSTASEADNEQRTSGSFLLKKEGENINDNAKDSEIKFNSKTDPSTNYRLSSTLDPLFSISSNQLTSTAAVAAANDETVGGSSSQSSSATDNYQQKSTGDQSQPTSTTGDRSTPDSGSSSSSKLSAAGFTQSSRQAGADTSSAEPTNLVIDTAGEPTKSEERHKGRAETPPPTRETNRQDCAGTKNGRAYRNHCGHCVGGKSGRRKKFGLNRCGACQNEPEACLDCKGKPFGKREVDICGKCRKPTNPRFNQGCGSKIIHIQPSLMILPASPSSSPARNSTFNFTVQIAAESSSNNKAFRQNRPPICTLTSASAGAGNSNALGQLEVNHWKRRSQKKKKQQHRKTWILNGGFTTNSTLSLSDIVEGSEGKPMMIMSCSSVNGTMNISAVNSQDVRPVSHHPKSIKLKADSLIVTVSYRNSLESVVGPKALSQLFCFEKGHGQSAAKHFPAIHLNMTTVQCNLNGRIRRPRPKLLLYVGFGPGTTDLLEKQIPPMSIKIEAADAMLQNVAFSDTLTSLIFTYDVNIDGPKDCKDVFPANTLNTFGANPKCNYRANRLQVRLGRSSAVTLASNIQLNVGAIVQQGAQLPDPSKLDPGGIPKDVKIARPIGAQFPTVICLADIQQDEEMAPSFNLKLDRILSSCDKQLKIKAVQIRGGGNRPLKFSWFLQKTEGSNVDGTRNGKIRSYLASKTSEMIVLTRDEHLTDGVSYEFRVKGCNFISACTPEYTTPVVQVSSADISYDINLIGLQRRVLAGQPIQLSAAEARVQQCGQEVPVRSINISYKWFLNETEIVKFRDQSQITFPRGYFLPNQYSTVTLESIASVRDVDVKAEDEIDFLTGGEPPTVMIGSRRVVLGNGQSLRLDASKSINNNEAGSLEFWWTCRLQSPSTSDDDGQGCSYFKPESNGDFLAFQNLPNYPFMSAALNVDADYLLPGKYEYIVSVSNHGYESSKSVTVVVKDVEMPSVNAVIPSGQSAVVKPSIDEYIPVKAEFSFDQPVSASIEFIDTEGYGSVTLPAHLSTPTNIKSTGDSYVYSLSIPPSSADGNWTGLTPNTEYLVKISVESDDGTAVGETEVSFKTNAPPTIGEISCHILSCGGDGGDCDGQIWRSDLCQPLGTISDDRSKFTCTCYQTGFVAAFWIAPPPAPILISTLPVEISLLLLTNSSVNNDNNNIANNKQYYTEADLRNISTTEMLAELAAGAIGTRPERLVDAQQLKLSDGYDRRFKLRVESSMDALQASESILMSQIASAIPIHTNRISDFEMTEIDNTTTELNFVIRKQQKSSTSKGIINAIMMTPEEAALILREKIVYNELQLSVKNGDQLSIVNDYAVVTNELGVDNREGDVLPVVIGGVVGGLFILVLVVVIALVVIKQKGRMDKMGNSLSSSPDPRSPMNSAANSASTTITVMRRVSIDEGANQSGLVGLTQGSRGTRGGGGGGRGGGPHQNAASRSNTQNQNTRSTRASNRR